MTVPVILPFSLIGKAVAKVTRARGGHGSALPGLVVERLSPHFLRNILAQLPHGVVVISGTNGKTTTTKMVVEMLRHSGLRVFTNDSGSNFTRGVVSSALKYMHGVSLDADIAVLELDEAHGVHFVAEVPPDYTLLLNVFRDQLDRFGEIDTTARLLGTIAQATRRQVVLNAGDPRIAGLEDGLTVPVGWFAAASSLREQFPTDDELRGVVDAVEPASAGAVQLVGLDGADAVYEINGSALPVTLSVFGSHNALNGAAALALVKAVLGDGFDAADMVDALSSVAPAFGRGEVLHIGGRQIRLTLVKNPSGFTLSLRGASTSPTYVAVNDASADGRDVSWFYDVDFGALRGNELVFVGGIRAYDMALRLEYDGVSVAGVTTDTATGLAQFLQASDGVDGQIFATYTAMLDIRKICQDAVKQ